MISQRQQAYLDAIGIEVWSLRNAPPPATIVNSSNHVSPDVSPDVAPDVAPDIASDNEPDFASDIAPGLKLGSGSGGVLLVCAADVDSASRLANDISRALGSVPVWAWPHDETDAVKLPAAVEDNLFTTVAIFGDDLAAQFFVDEIPASLNSANLVLLPSMQDIQSSADARKSLWATFCRSGMVSNN